MHRPGPCGPDRKCRPSRRRKDADDALMSANKQSPLAFAASGAAVLVALAMAVSARAEVAGSPAAAVTQSATPPATPAPSCSAPRELTRFVHPLARTARRLA